VPNESTRSRIDIEEITTRNDMARHIVAGFSAAMPTLADIWEYLEGALADTQVLAAEITALRLDRANLLAAMRATLGAHAEGEQDPLSYLRDELDDHQSAIQPPREAT
jgi:hypothetical protein